MVPNLPKVVENRKKGTKRTMCIMEVRVGQKTSTIAQAMFHNTYTLLGDLDMLLEVLKARKDHDSLETVNAVHEHIKRASALLLTQFGMEVANETQDHEGHNPDEHGHERSFVETAHHDAQLARRYMTR
jgi:hypothetical protein